MGKRGGVLVRGGGGVGGRLGGGASATKIRERLLDPRGASRQQSSECENKGKLCGILI